MVQRCINCIYLNFKSMTNTTPALCDRHNRKVEDFKKEYCIIEDDENFLQKYDTVSYKNI